MEKEDLKYIAYHDNLTQLKNRKAFEDDMSNLDIREITLVSIDANNLKKMNDSFGHEMGDKLLISVAKTIMKVFGENSYRTGGDEFLAILEAKDEELIKRLRERFKEELEKENDRAKEKDLIISAAIGFSIGGAGKSLKEMMKEADEDMYSDKREYKLTEKTKEDKEELQGLIKNEYNKQLGEETKRTKHLIVSSVIKLGALIALCVTVTNYIT